MEKPLRIFIDGKELLGYTGATLSRSKDKMTGSLDIDLFFSYVPDAPIVTDASRGRDVAAYVGGHLAFVGTIDTRDGNITKDDYSVKISCRGKTKLLVDSSHRHPTTNMLQPTNRDAIEKLIEGFEVDLDWKATNIDLDKLRFRDGAHIIDELIRIGTENAHFIYETRDGKLRVTDDTGRTTGEDLILGQNILTCSAKQTEAGAKSEIKVKGQRTKKDIRGVDAILDRVKTVKADDVRSTLPLIIQHYGDATDESLKRRAKFEADKRNAKTKSVSMDVFHVQSSNGDPWDIGQMHYIEIPPEGVADVMECTELTYTVEAQGTLKTSLTFTPLPSANSGGGLLSGVDAVADAAQKGGAIKSKISTPEGQYPDNWGQPILTEVDFTVSDVGFFNSVQEQVTPLTLDVAP